MIQIVSINNQLLNVCGVYFPIIYNESSFSTEFKLTYFNEQQHKQFIDALNQIMPFGKYKGHRMYELPGHYLAWFHRQGFPDSRLGQQMALVFELDHNALMPLFKKYLLRD